MGGRIARSARLIRHSSTEAEETGGGHAHVWVVKRVGGMVGRTKVTMECALCGQTRVARTPRTD